MGTGGSERMGLRVKAELGLEEAWVLGSGVVEVVTCGTRVVHFALLVNFFVQACLDGLSLDDLNHSRFIRH